MMGRRGGREALVGVVVAGSIIIFAGGILLIGEQTQLFRPKVGYQTVFHTVSGLRAGSPVSMAGVEIGVVSAIELPKEATEAGIKVDLRVDEAYRHRVREGTRASLRLLQYVTNEKYVELSPGDPNLPELKEGAVIPVEEGLEILETGQTIADNLEVVTVSLMSILEKVQAGEGLLGQAIMDPEFGQEGLASLKAAADGADHFLRQVNQGSGLLGRVVTDQAFADALLGDLQEATSRITALLERLEGGEGALGQLLEPGQSEEDMAGILGDMRESAAALRKAAEALESPDGLAGRLLHDREYGERLSRHLEEALTHLASIARKVDEGEGTLGALVNDPSLHRAAQDLAYGTRKSRVVSWAVRHYREKGEKAGTKDKERD